MDQLTAALTGIVPRHSSGALLQEDGASAVLTDSGHEQLHRLNPTALAIWELCDGETSVPEMVDAAAVLFATVSVTQLQRDVVGVLRHLTTAGLIEWIVPSEAVGLEVLVTPELNDES